MNEVTGTQVAPSRRLRPLLLLPLAVFVALAGVFLTRLLSGTDPSIIPSVLIGKPAPEFNLPALEGVGVAGLSRADLMGRFTLVNIFGSWCAPCRQEHRMLMEVAKDTRVRLVGIDYKDTPEGARRFLAELGNPYAAIGVDKTSRAYIDWGAYGVPETFLVGPDGVIISKIIGELTPRAFTEVILPAVEAAALKQQARPSPAAPAANNG
jgi:cytochrome c biogenesis protein CcmG/thiol:disulfide interchange protein DsbE